MMMTWIGIALMTILSSARLAQVLVGNWWSLPLLAHSLLAAILLVMHGRAAKDAPAWQEGVAWASALLPLAVQMTAEVPWLVRVISLVGMLYSVWGLVSLGRAFDIVPADRGLVTHGPYRFMRHPIYAGELFSVLVMGISQPSIWNVLVMAALAFTLVLRIRWEEKIIGGYARYARVVNFRLIPGVW
jgi:protein-S-isoprenylcysteine O-methyltransferase Ste14